MKRDHLTILIMVLYINTKINLKNKNFFIDIFFYLWIDGDSNFIQLHYRLMVHQKLLNWYHFKLGNILMVFNGLANDNEIA
jgi:hypothetical protein